MTSLSKEEENYVRMGLLLTGISPRATRALFDSEFHPSCLDASLKKETKKLRDLKEKKNINQRQWDLLFPRKPDVPKSDNFDVTLMITLLRNLTNLSEPQKGYDHLPSPTEITTASDLARIKYYRNYLAHLENSTVDNVIFTSAWEDTSQAIGRLGGQHMQKECDELKTKVLDQTNKEIILEIKHSQNEIEELKQLLQKTKEELLTRIDEVPPKHIQDQINNQIEDWKKKDQMFVNTRASDYVTKYLQTNSCVTLTAPAGVGKSFTARHIALVLQKERYKIIPVYSPTDIRDYYQPGKRTVFIIDDICGNFIADHEQIENWKQLLPVINRIIADKHCKIIVCCRLQIYKDDKFKLLSAFMSCECNLMSNDLCLTVKEKTKIAEMYIGIKSNYLDEATKSCEFFPLLCYLCHEKKYTDVTDYFRNPFGVYKNELDNLNRHRDVGKQKVCSLALCVLFNNRLLEKWFQGKVTDEQQKILEDTCEACKLNKSTSKSELKEALDTLDGTFICTQNGIYSTIHDKLFDFIVHYFGQKMIECLIEHGNSNLVNERFIWQKSTDEWKRYIEFIIEIPDANLDSYLKRLIKDWSAGMVALVLNNANMEVSAFRQQLLENHLLQLDESQQISLAHIKDESDLGIVPLLFTCNQGYTDMVQWLLDNEADVNQSDTISNKTLLKAWSHELTAILKSVKLMTSDSDLNYIYCFTPLYIAVVRWQTEIVQMLLSRNANVDLCFNCGFSTFLRRKLNENKELLSPDDHQYILNGSCPLSVASEIGHTDIVKLLLEKNPKVDQRDHNGRTALYIACWKGHTRIVRMLLEKNPNVDLCHKNGNSPLCIAIQERHTYIVRLLLERNPNLCDNNDVNALFVACYYGHTDIVRILLEKNPNVDLSIKNGCHRRRLMIQYEYIDIVEMSVVRYRSLEHKEYTTNFKRHTFLISSLSGNDNADLCNNNGCSPLYIAIQNGHTDIVWLLLERNPNVDVCNMHGVTALYIASYLGFSDIVRALLQKNPNIDLCYKTGCSPLYIASKFGHTKVVKFLLERNPNVDICDMNGCSPLLLAIKYKFTDVVRLLLERNPNVDLCDNKGFSPLLLAIQNGLTEEVKLLLERNPNVDLCNTIGVSPLLLASLNGLTEIVGLLLERNPNVDKCDIHGTTALWHACNTGRSTIVSMLLEKNPDTEPNAILGFTPLICSCSIKNFGIVQQLIKHKANVNAQAHDGSTALGCSARQGDIELTKFLLENNANCNFCIQGKQSLEGILRNNPLVTLDIFKQHLFDSYVEKLSLNVKDYVNKKSVEYVFDVVAGSSPLHIVCFIGWKDAVSCLLDHHANINLTKEDGTTPLFYASELGHEDIVRLLLEKGADTETCRHDGKSPLTIAIDNGHQSVIMMIKKHKNTFIQIHNLSVSIGHVSFQ